MNQISLHWVHFNWMLSSIFKEKNTRTVFNQFIFIFDAVMVSARKIVFRDFLHPHAQALFKDCWTKNSTHILIHLSLLRYKGKQTQNTVNSLFPENNWCYIYTFLYIPQSFQAQSLCTRQWRNLCQLHFQKDCANVCGLDTCALPFLYQEKVQQRLLC